MDAPLSRFHRWLRAYIALAMVAMLAVPLVLTLLARLGPPAIASRLAQDGLVGEVPAVREKLRLSTLWSGEFQRRFEPWFAQAGVPRTWTVRRVNQLYYSLFDRSEMYWNGLAIGRDRTLFEKFYIRVYCQSDHPPPIDRTGFLDNLASLNRLLTARGRPLVVVLSPSKAVTVPEYLPKGICPPPRAPERLGEEFVEALRDRGVFVLDGAALARAYKRFDPLPPFPRGGTHWNNAIGQRVASQLMADLSRLYHRDMGSLTLGAMRWNEPVRGTDGDLATILNLKTPPLDYPTGNIAVRCRPAAGRDDALYLVAGSFTLTYGMPIAACGLFKKADLFFYYTLRRMPLPETLGPPVDRARLDWRAALAGHAAVVIELNEAVLLGEALQPYRDFVEDATAALTP